MAEKWRIFVVEGEEKLNRNMLNSLRKDGYVVQGALNGADAVRALWSEEYDVVVCDLKTPGAGGFELLQWLRAYRPNTRIIMVGGMDSSMTRTQALESGAVGYLEKPLDLHLLKEELRRLLQQTGFSADLDSFDLLDVIQVITMSRNNIALLVNTGLEERGTLRFQNGELIWAEYGTLRGEEAFFALAAHKNGSVVQQHWNDPIIPNVKQPLSRLILQALQYRTKYANMEPYAAEPEVDSFVSLDIEEDDTPFVVQAESSPAQMQDNSLYMATNQEPAPVNNDQSREWWERTGAFPTMQESMGHIFAIPINNEAPASPPLAANGYALTDDSAASISSPEHKTPASQRSDLPSWLTDQPTASNLPVVRPSSLSNSARIPVTPVLKSSSPEWQVPVSAV
ncbi:MAG: response regulator, partial [Chloroflexi bacterium]|nr:response regulator [Chloroflexota bacterium]